jgi:hypothetical protein
MKGRAHFCEHHPFSLDLTTLLGGILNPNYASLLLQIPCVYVYRAL